MSFRCLRHENGWVHDAAIGVFHTTDVAGCLLSARMDGFAEVKSFVESDIVRMDGFTNITIILWHNLC